MSRTVAIPMAQGYMKLECDPNHVGAHWVELKPQQPPVYAYIEDIDDEEPAANQIWWSDLFTDIDYSTKSVTPTWLSILEEIVFVVDDDIKGLRLRWNDESEITDPVLWNTTALEHPLWIEYDIYGNITADDKLLPIPWYVFPDLANLPEDKVEKLYWNMWSLSGITNPYLLRFREHIKNDTEGEIKNTDYRVGVWGSHSFRTTIPTYHDDDSDSSEIP